MAFLGQRFRKIRRSPKKLKVVTDTLLQTVVQVSIQYPMKDLGNWGTGLLVEGTECHIVDFRMTRQAGL
jgi:hypothetical protein